MAWMDKYLPSNVAKGLSNSLSRASEWAKKWSEGEGGQEKVRDGGQKKVRGRGDRRR